MHKNHLPFYLVFSFLCISETIYAQEDIEQLKTIDVSADASNKTDQSLGFQMESIDASRYKNSSVDINKVINSSPGVIIRESGGLGSKFRLSINGLSENQIRYFIDGMPMENFGSSLSLNNFPINLVEGIEIYKGVTPISLAADALGGAINIITPNSNETLVDLSYSYGSFNTHRASVSAQSSFRDKYYIRVSSFFNHSDNDYTMKKISKKDKFGNKIGTKQAKRFHDSYTSGMINIKGGVFDTNYADDLSLSLTYAQNRNDEQHPERSINKIFGGFHSTNKTYLSSLTYQKKFDKFNLKAYILKGKINESTNDFVSRTYDWDGSYVEKSDPNAGELSTRSIFKRKDSIFQANLSSKYNLTNQSFLQASFSSNQLDRSGNDKLNKNNTSFTRPNFVNKHVLSGAYGFNTTDKKFNSSVFIKKYFYDAKIVADEYVDFNLVNNMKTEVDLSKVGYGLTTKYNINERINIKASYENAYRFPEPDEILGSGKYILPSRDLNPETSHNLNLSLNYKMNLDDLQFTNNINLFYRNAENYIRYIATQFVFGRYQNLNKVKVKGLEVATSLLYKNYSLQFNTTWQNMTDKTKLDYEGEKNDHYGDKIPNEPYLFANLKLGTHFDLSDKNSLSTCWSAKYVHDYFLHWESSGNRSDKYVIPSQFTHDVGITYSMNKGTYYLSLDGVNIFNKSVYDNYNIQKPGRAFYLKVGYLY